MRRIASSLGGSILIAGVSAALFAALAADGANDVAVSTAAAGAQMGLASLCLIAFGEPRSLGAARVPSIGVGLACLAILLPAWFRPPGYQGDMELAVLAVFRLGGFAGCAIAGAAIAAQHKRATLLLGWLVGLGGAFVLLGVVVSHPLMVGGDAAILRGRFGGLMLNANAAAAVFGVVAILGLTALVIELRRPAFYQLREAMLVRMLAISGVIVLALGACALTRSRGTLALTVACAIPLLVRNIRSRPARGVLTVLVLAIIMFLAQISGETLDRFQTFDQDLKGRLLAYGVVASWIGDAPWFGHGAGTFVDLNLRHLDARHVAMMWDWAAAHNFVLQILVEGGVALLTALLACWSAMAIKMWRDPPLDASVERDGFLSALLLLTLCGTYDVALNVPAIGALASLMLGLCWGLSLAQGSRA